MKRTLNHRFGMGQFSPSDFITPEWLMEIHHGLTKDEAHLLWMFCHVHTIRFKECYGDGQIMFPLWCNIMDNLDKQINAIWMR